MAGLEHWITAHPYNEADLARMETEKTRPGRYYDSVEYGNWLVERTSKFVKGTFLEQEHVPFQAYMHPYAFGYKVGPHFCFESGTLHEIAHAIQLKKNQYNSRLKKSSRFQEPASSVQTVLNQRFYEPRTMEPSMVESEALAIQAIMMERLGYQLDLEEYFKDHARILCTWMADSYMGGRSEEARQKTRVRFMEAFYDMWNHQHDVMDTRYQNVCKYIGKLRKENPIANS